MISSSLTRILHVDVQLIFGFFWLILYATGNLWNCVSFPLVFKISFFKS